MHHSILIISQEHMQTRTCIMPKQTLNPKGQKHYWETNCILTYSVSSIQSSSNSTWLSVGSRFLCKQHLPCSVSVWRMLGSSEEVQTKNILHIGLLRVNFILACKRCESEFNPQWTEIGCFLSNSNTTTIHTPQVENIIGIECKTTTGKSQGANSRRKPHWVEG